MDFPVEATVHLGVFHDEVKVRELLRSHDFRLIDAGRQQVLVQGSFLKLKAVKTCLEQLLNSQKLTGTTQHSSPYFSGAASEYYSGTSQGPSGGRGRSGPSDSPIPHPSSPIPSAPRGSDASRCHQTSTETGAKQRDAFRPRSELFVVDADAFRYAERLRKKDLDLILDNHNVKMIVKEVGDSCQVTLLGKSASAATAKLQSLLGDLSKSLRTQEVPLRQMDQEGQAFLDRIRGNNNVHDSVLVCEMNDRLHLVGSSAKSYEVKQRLLGRSAEPSGRAGRTTETGARSRSRSLPPINRADRREVAHSPPAGAAGYFPSRYRDDEQGGAKPTWEAGASRGLSVSQSQEKGRGDKLQDFLTEMRDGGKPPGLKQLMAIGSKDIKQKLRGSRNK